jgi:ankyrin repeat protein
MHMALICGNMDMFSLIEKELKRRAEKLEMMSELRNKFAINDDSSSSSSPSKLLSKSPLLIKLQRADSRGIIAVELPPLPFRKNKEGYNCFELAAAYGSTDTFEALLDSLRVKQW